MRLFTISLLVLLSFFACAQDVTYTLTVNSMNGGPDAGRDVVFIETSTYERLAFKTDATGRLTVHFDHGEKWLGSIGEMRNCIELVTRGSGTANKMTTYDPEGYDRENQVLPDRRSINFTIVDQGTIRPNMQSANTKSLVTIVLQDQDRRNHSRVPVQLVCYETQTIYRATTSVNGAVKFEVPVSNNYEIDVDGVESLRYIDLDERPRDITLTILYEPRTFSETNGSRFVVQNVPANVQPSSSHARIKLKIRKHNSPAIDEDVYVRMLKSNKVYQAKTDDQGAVTFMLPIGGQFMIDFQFQRDADLIDLSRVRGIAYKENTVVYIPDPRLENIEEFIPKIADLIEYDMHNFVEAQYPEPVEGDMDFYLKWGNKFNDQSKEALLEIGLKIKSKMTRKSTARLNVCFVIDKSGSMGGGIQQLKKSLIRFIDQLNSDDIVSIVVFDGSATVAIPAQEVGDKKAIIDVVHAIQAGGGTNIYSGLIQGFTEIQKLDQPKMVNRVILLTDGYGGTPVETIVSYTKSFTDQGIELSTVGVGTGYNQALLSQLATAGGGMLHTAGTTENIEEAFQRELQSILYPMANNATLTVSYNDQIIYRQLYGYANEQVTNGQMTVGIDHLFPGLDKLALVKFDIINSTRAIEQQPIIVKLEYEDAITGKKITKEKRIHPEWTTATGALDMSIDMEHKKVMAVAIANQSLKVMSNTFHGGDRAGALVATQSAIDQINALFPDAKSEGLIAIVARLQEYVNAFEYFEANNDYGSQ
ncbi:MAG: VWA domain-containing protein [Crocinitomicaceae bacterium]|nr:VWA domain-containing protein [Crocinitomicaceae bacterium]